MCSKKSARCNGSSALRTSSRITRQKPDADPRRSNRPTTGLLESQIQAMNQQGVTPEINHAEQYLMLLGWTSTLMISMEAKERYPKVLARIKKSIGKMLFFNLTARGTCKLAQQFGRELRRSCKSDWGERLCDAWKELDSTLLDELLQERNKGTHHTVNNDEKTQKVLVKYSELIEKFTPALENIDWPKIDVSDEKITGNDELRGALFISRGKKMTAVLC